MIKLQWNLLDTLEDFLAFIEEEICSPTFSEDFNEQTQIVESIFSDYSSGLPEDVRFLIDKIKIINLSEINRQERLLIVEDLLDEIHNNLQVEE